MWVPRVGDASCVPVDGYKTMWSNVSDAAKALVRSLLTVQPAQRAAASAVLGGEWLQAVCTPRGGWVGKVCTARHTRHRVRTRAPRARRAVCAAHTPLARSSVRRPDITTDDRHSCRCASDPTAAGGLARSPTAPVAAQRARGSTVVRSTAATHRARCNQSIQMRKWSSGMRTTRASSNTHWSSAALFHSFRVGLLTAS